MDGSISSIDDYILGSHDRMEAKRCLLTHFSQRYPKMLDLGSRTAQNKMQIALASDLMSIRVGDFWRFQHFIEPISEILGVLEEEKNADFPPDILGDE